MQGRYAALVLPANLENFLDGYPKHLPRFNGETCPSAKDHVSAFLDFADNMNIEREDVYMRLFVQSLEGNVRILFRQLRVDSIKTWNVLITILKNQWGVKKDLVYFLTEFEELKRNPSELVVEFIKNI